MISLQAKYTGIKQVKQQYSGANLVGLAPVNYSCIHSLKQRWKFVCINFFGLRVVSHMAD